MSQKEAVVEFAHDERGLLVTIGADDGRSHQAVLVPRNSVLPESRMALAAFVDDIAVVKTIDDIAQDEQVMCAENCQIMINGLPLTIRRGQKVDNLEMIEKLLLAGRRLLHDSPEATDISSESVLEAAVSDEKYKGMAMTTLVARRAAGGK